MDIIWMKKARKSLDRLDNKNRTTVFDAVEKLSAWPDCRNVKALKNHQYPYRLRVGDYRVFFTVKDVLEIIFIEEVKKRDENTY